MRFYRPLIILATLLALVVIPLGAYVRLSDAGLGCPDWPGCYGHLIGVPDAPHEQATALHAFPDKPVETAKAWKEMAHRYLAGALGMLIALIALLAWKYRNALNQSPRLPFILLGVVGLQALLGMWTVTLMLKPVIVSAHLLGGMLTLALLVLLLLARPAHPIDPVRSRIGSVRAEPVEARSAIDELRTNELQSYSGRINRQKTSVAIRVHAALAILAVLMQIALGGWVSSNYAALACIDFPTCLGAWVPETDFTQAFRINRESGLTAGDDSLSPIALITIHWSHRMGALVVALIAGSLSFALLRLRDWRNWGLLLGAILLAQIGLGIANVLFHLPLAFAVAHNAGAAFLLTASLALNVRLWQATQHMV